MSLCKTDAIVLRNHKLGETSKILSLYSKKEGRLKVVAKGARGLRSRFFGSLESLNHVSVVYYRKENRELQFLSQAEILDSFMLIREDLDRFALASIASEIVLKSQYAEEANPALFTVFLDFLKNLNDEKDAGDSLFLWFELQYLKSTGFAPKLDNCLMCQRDSSQEKYLFSISRGGYICDACKSSDSTGVLVSHQSVENMRTLSDSGIDIVLRIHKSQYVLKESIGIMHKFMAFHIPGLEHLKSVDFLQKLGL